MIMFERVPRLFRSLGSVYETLALFLPVYLHTYTIKHFKNKVSR